MSLKQQLISLGTAAAIVIGFTAVASAATAYATNNVNVRSGPGTSYRVIDVLRRGDDVDIQYCRGSWCLIENAGPDGWVSASYLTRGGGGDYYDDDDYYDRPVYIERPRYRYRNHHRRDFYTPRSGICVGGRDASFCISN